VGLRTEDKYATSVLLVKVGGVRMLSGYVCKQAARLWSIRPQDCAV